MWKELISSAVIVFVCVVLALVAFGTIVKHRFDADMRTAEQRCAVHPGDPPRGASDPCNAHWGL